MAPAPFHGKMAGDMKASSSTTRGMDRADLSGLTAASMRADGRMVGCSERENIRHQMVKSIKGRSNTRRSQAMEFQ